MASTTENKIGRLIAVRLGPKEDLLDGILTACRPYGFQAAVLLSGIGSLQQVRVHNEVPMSTAGEEIIYGYDTEPRAWGGRQGVTELCSTKGTIRAAEDGTLQGDLYITFSNAAGTVLGGHLAKGTLVKLTAEIVIGELV